MSTAIEELARGKAVGAGGMASEALAWMPLCAKHQLCALFNAYIEGPQRELLRPEAWAHAIATAMNDVVAR